jgi:hypothetical protein
MLPKMLSIAAVLEVALAAGFFEPFHAPNRSLFVPMTGLRHCDDVCFESDDRMLTYGADLGHGKRGLVVTTSKDACAHCAHVGDACWDANTSACAPFASQYLMSADPNTGIGNYFKFGAYVATSAGTPNGIGRHACDGVTRAMQVQSVDAHRALGQRDLGQRHVLLFYARDHATVQRHVPAAQ